MQLAIHNIFPLFDFIICRDIIASMSIDINEYDISRERHKTKVKQSQLELLWWPYLSHITIIGELWNLIVISVYFIFDENSLLPLKMSFTYRLLNSIE